ncbi:uncharacterized protein LOC116158754 [Photinus pyralis]|uniref:uncharacterized protein LOC116158754 n=1 Tax=Photinus pyralis TaxID=7054 RepID=UPI001267784D|nr:uncharacterized protein LOC116158754 [Photinus pyralis]
MKPWQWRRYKQCIMRVTTFFAILPLIFAYKFNANPRLLRELTDLRRPHIEPCIAQSNVDRSMAVNTLIHQDYPDDRPYWCYTKCMASRIGLYNVSLGEFEYVGRPRDLTKELYDHCAPKYRDESDECRKVYSTIVCFLKGMTTEA